MKKTPLKHDIKAWLKTRIKPEYTELADMITRESDPTQDAQLDAARRREGYTDEELDTMTVTLREHFDMQDRLTRALFKQRSALTSNRLQTMDNHLSIGDARGAQSALDKKNTKLRKRIKELEAEVAELKHQRDELLKRLTAATGAEVVA